MRIGAVFPQLEIGPDAGAVRAWAQAVEELGYHHALAFDHVLGAGVDTRPGWRGYTSDELFHEVFVLFGYLAGITTTLELVTGVLVVTQRQTALVAKQAAEVDVLSGGRLRLGVGIGWNQVEYEALGVPFSQRGARLDEQVALLRELWAAPTTTFTGRWHTVDNAGIKPRPVREDIPIWFGGTVDAVLRRTGRVGDGWFPERWPDARAAAMVATIHEAAAEAGRHPDRIGLEPRLMLNQVPERDRLRFAADWQELGATHLTVQTMDLGLATVDDHIAVLRDTIELLAPVVDERSS